MNLYHDLENKIDNTKIASFNGDEYELALVRYVLKETAKQFYRNRIFFLEEEQIAIRKEIYEQEIDPKHVTCFEIVCSNYCRLLKQVLENNYNLQIQIIPTDHDVFKHIALVLITKSGNQYLMDPLMDLTQMKMGMRTHHFATQGKEKNPFMKTKLKGLSFINDTTLGKIDEAIGYTHNYKYTDDTLISLKNRENENHLISNSEIVKNKIVSFLELRKKQKIVKGIVDLRIYVKEGIKILLTKQQYRNVQISDFFIDVCDLKDKKLLAILEGDKIRKRGLVLNFDNTNLIVSSASPDFIMVNQKEWEQKKYENNIFVKNRKYIQLYHELMDLDLEPNILNHREFLRIFYQFEKKIVQSGKNPKDQVTVINRETIVINDDIPITITIENNELILINHRTKQKYKILYKDEGRNIVYQPVT